MEICYHFIRNHLQNKRVFFVDESCPHADWDEFVICTMELYAPRWKSPGTLMEIPFTWRYGIRCLRGLTQVSLRKTYFIEKYGLA